MKLSVFAIGYDGAIARAGRLDDEARAALLEARRHGVAVVAVSGRRVEELRDAAGGLAWADALVAENGAVIAFPGREPHLLAGRVPSQLLLALEREEIPFSAGQCAIEASAADAARILGAVRSLELPLALHFNHGQVVVLPQGISKATGLREVLREFRLSTHNAVAIGHGEDDHGLLELCEVGAAVQWGSASLRHAADEVVPGTGPSDVAAYVRRALAGMSIPAVPRVRRRVTLGRTRDGRPVELGVRGRTLLVAGDPRSGKSWAVGLVCEQLLVLGYSLCVIDPEGDYATLESLPGVVVFGGAYSLPEHHEVIRALGHPDLSVVVDLSRVSHTAKTEYLRALLPALARFRGGTGLPHRIVIDEAHYFLNRPDVREFIDLQHGGYTLVTYRVSDLDAEILAAVDAVIMTHTSDEREVATLGRVGGVPNDPLLGALLGDLAIDEAAIVRSRDDEPHVERFQLANRRTVHVRHRAKYRDVPLPAQRAFLFTRASRAFGAPIRTLRGFVDAAARAPDDVLGPHARRGDFSRWIGEVFGDEPLAAALREVEHLYRKKEVPDLKAAIIEAISLRYELGSPDA